LDSQASTARSGHYPDSPSITKEDVIKAQQILEENGLILENIRLTELGDEEDGAYELLICDWQQE